MWRYNVINAIHNQKKQLIQSLQILIDLWDEANPSTNKKYSITGEDLIIYMEHQKYFFKKSLSGPICSIFVSENQEFSYVG